MCHKRRTPQDMNKTNLWSNQVGTENLQMRIILSLRMKNKIIIKHLFYGLSNLNKLKRGSVGNVCKTKKQKRELTLWLTSMANAACFCKISGTLHIPGTSSRP